MKNVDSWLELAQYDLETARAMMATGRYLYVLFCCQQTLEKALKALIAKQTNEFPPRTHSLMRLAGITTLELTDEQGCLFADLSNYYISTRYTETVQCLSENITKTVAGNFLEQTEKALKWIRSMI